MLAREVKQIPRVPYLCTMCPRLDPNRESVAERVAIGP